MTDFRPAEESYSAPPHVIPGHPYSWDVVGAVPGPGEVSVGTDLEIAKVDSAGVDRTADFANLRAGDIVNLVHGPGDVLQAVLAGPPTDDGDYFTLTGATVTGATLEVGDRVTVQVVLAPLPVVDPAPPPEPFDPNVYTIAEVKSYLDDLADASPEHDHDPAVIAETQRVLEAELAGQNRATLVEWLDHRYGVVHP